jgi:DMSO/TMAO reductase YedYZ molybdopterin-dependent catalytic subunit
VQVARLLDAETPVQEFASSLTPNSRFFVRCHFGPPPAELLFDPNRRLSVGGIVDRPLTFALKELKQCEEVAVTAVVQSSGRRVLGDRLTRTWFDVCLGECVEPARHCRHACMVEDIVTQK